MSSWLHDAVMPTDCLKAVDRKPQSCILRFCRILYVSVQSMLIASHAVKLALPTVMRRPGILRMHFAGTAAIIEQRCSNFQRRKLIASSDVRLFVPHRTLRTLAIKFPSRQHRPSALAAAAAAAAAAASLSHASSSDACYVRYAPQIEELTWFCSLRSTARAEACFFTQRKARTAYATYARRNEPNTKKQTPLLTLHFACCVTCLTCVPCVFLRSSRSLRNRLCTFLASQASVASKK